MEELQHDNLDLMAKGFLSAAAVARRKPYPISEYQKMSLNDLRTSDASGRGTRLFKFFSDERSADNRNYSEEALKNQTVYLANPKDFNDPFDCVIGYDKQKTMRSCLSKLASYLGIAIDEHDSLVDCECRFAEELGSLDGNELPRLQKLEDGASRLWYHMTYYYILSDAIRRGMSAIDGNAVHAGLLMLFSGVEAITSNYGVTCFTDSVENGYMWAHYAAGYRGFAIEYENDLDQLEALGFPDELAELLGANIWDVFYLLERPDSSDVVKQYVTCSTGSDWITRLYVKGLCTKHLFWSMENESRLVLPLSWPPIATNRRNIPFFPAKCVYLGISMPIERKREIISICGKLSHPPKVFNMTTDTTCFSPHFKEVLEEVKG